MRSIWLASAALFMTAGMACAQTSTTAPAPTGAINAPTEVQPGQAPGKTAPPNAGTTIPSPVPSQNGSGMSSPAPDGAVSAPAEVQPGQSPGKTAPNNAGMTNGTGQTSSTSGPTAHHWSHHKGITENAGPRRYLYMARHAIAHHDTARAESALSHAETRLLTRSVQQTSATSLDHSPTVRSIEKARQALKSNDFTTAAQETDAALQGMPSHGGVRPQGQTGYPQGQAMPTQGQMPQ